MSTGAAVGCGLLLGMAVVVAFFALAPLTSDWGQPDAEREKTMRRMAHATTVTFGASAVLFVVSILTLGTLPTVVTGVNMALTGIGMLVQRRAINRKPATERD